MFELVYMVYLDLFTQVLLQSNLLKQVGSAKIDGRQKTSLFSAGWSSVHNDELDA